MVRAVRRSNIETFLGIFPHVVLLELLPGQHFWKLDRGYISLYKMAFHKLIRLHIKQDIPELEHLKQGSSHQSRLVLRTSGTVRCVGPNGAGIPDLQFQALSSLDIHVRSCEHHEGVFLEAFFLGQVLDHQTYNDLSIGSAKGVKSRNLPHVICRIWLSVIELSQIHSVSGDP